MKTDNVVKEKSLSFGIRIVKMVRHLLKSYTYAEHPIFTQILKCGTSIGANVSEASQAQSKKDFESKMSIALKEANETEYWLRLLKATDYLTEKEYTSIYNDCIELEKLLTSIIKTSKKR